MAEHHAGTSRSNDLQKTILSIKNFYGIIDRTQPALTSEEVEKNIRVFEEVFAAKGKPWLNTVNEKVWFLVVQHSIFLIDTFFFDEGRGHQLVHVSWTVVHST
jgi:hypothetical protein